MKWIRRILTVTLLLLVLLLICGIVGYRLLHARPDWYGHFNADPQRREEAAGRIEDQLVNAGNWAAELQVAREHASADHYAGGQLELSFTEEELNAVISKWAELAGSAVPFSDPQIMLADGQITLAATSKEVGTVVSMRIAPRIDQNGDAHMEIAQVMGGKLPLPGAAWQPYAKPLADKLAAQLPAEDRGAKTRSDGSVNDEMVSAALSRMMLHWLKGEPARPILFVTYFQNNRSRNLPVKITTFQIQDKTVKMTLQPLPAGEKIDD